MIELIHAENETLSAQVSLSSTNGTVQIYSVKILHKIPNFCFQLADGGVEPNGAYQSNSNDF